MEGTLAEVEDEDAMSLVKIHVRAIKGKKTGELNSCLRWFDLSDKEFEGKVVSYGGAHAMPCNEKFFGIGKVLESFVYMLNSTLTNTFEYLEETCMNRCAKSIFV